MYTLCTMYSFYGHVKSYAPPLVWGTRKKVKTHLELTVLCLKKGMEIFRAKKSIVKREKLTQSAEAVLYSIRMYLCM